MNCPGCGSPSVASNKIGEPLIEHVANVGRMARDTQYSAVSFASIAIWGGLKAINALRSDWRCGICGHRF